jgi:3-ketosteroid 9alpha-monooxygenase subunit A
MSRFPFPRYPNGWFQVAYSEDLPPAGVLPLKYFGRDLVLFRSGDGAPNLLDAHCPHLGAHLGYGGKVDGNCIRCPFHAWEFDGRGQCTKVPYSEKAPPARAKIRPWQVREVNGLIMAWHHAQGEAPTWEISPIPEHGHAEWTAYEKRFWKIKTHNQEMAENAVDSAHFHYVHGTVDKPTSKATIEGHILRVLSDTKMRTPVGKVTGQVESTSYGFGYALTRFTGIVETLLVAGITPIDDDYVDVRFAFTVKKAADKDVTSTVGAAFMREIERQLGQDIPIWEHKVYVNPPLVVDGDGPIGIFRRWVKQFYSEPRGEERTEIAASAE